MKRTLTVLAGALLGAIALYPMPPLPICTITRDGNIWIVRTPNGILYTDSTDVAFARLEADCGVSTGGN